MGLQLSINCALQRNNTLQHSPHQQNSFWIADRQITSEFLFCSFNIPHKSVISIKNVWDSEAVARIQKTGERRKSTQSREIPSSVVRGIRRKWEVRNFFPKSRRCLPSTIPQTPRSQRRSRDGRRDAPPRRLPESRSGADASLMWTLTVRGPDTIGRQSSV